MSGGWDRFIVLVILALFSLQTRAAVARLLNEDQQEEIPRRWPTFDMNTAPFLIAHRGEPAFQPEETLGSYTLAALEGAEYLEPDLVVSKDGHLICFHDVDLGPITDVENYSQFQSRYKTRWVFSEDRFVQMSGYFVDDFTLEELKMLRVQSRQKGVRPLIYNQLFQILTFEEYIDIVLEYSHKLNRQIGLIPELKHPKYFADIRPDQPHYFEDKMLQVLEQKGFSLYGNQKEAVNGFTRVVIQCFELDTLIYLRSKTDFHLTFLVEKNAYYLTPRGILEASIHIDSLSFWKEFLTSGAQKELAYKNISYNSTQIEKSGGFIAPHKFVEYLHDNNLRAVIYTLYTSTETSHHFCALGCRNVSRSEELQHYFQLGVDALFVENYGEAAAIRSAFEARILMKQQERLQGNYGYIRIEN